MERKRKSEIMSKQSNVESGAAVAGAATGSEIEVGKTYKLRHCRFGNATVKILSVTPIKDEYKPYLPTDAWIDTEVVSGFLRGINDEGYPGDQKTLRQSHCTFSPNAPS